MDAEKQEAVEQKFHWGNVLTLSLGHLMHDTYSSFLAPILPLLIKRLGLSYSLAGLLAVFQRAPSLINPFIGLLADRITLRYFVIIAPTVTAIVMSLLPLSPNYVIMAMLLLIVGFSSSFFHVPAPVMVRWVSGKRIGTGMSFFMLGGELARSIGPLVILGRERQEEDTGFLSPLGWLDKIRSGEMGLVGYSRLSTAGRWSARSATPRASIMLRVCRLASRPGTSSNSRTRRTFSAAVRNGIRFDR